MLICPICDSTLVNRFCPVCKKIVKNPWVLDDRVFINRSHSLPDGSQRFLGDFCKAKSLKAKARSQSISNGGYGYEENK